MMAYWQNPYTKRRLNFQQQAAPEFLQKKNIFGTISPTQVANYPMQSFATGDVMPEVIGAVGEVIWRSDLRTLCLPINTVHDSIIFDVRSDVVVEAGRLVKSTMESATELMQARFGGLLDLPFPVDVEYGSNWEDIKHLSLT
jgi:DNA polymerase I-like protein with 3'-5' exonuclease and polymerase domains